MSLLTRYKTPSAPAQVLAEGHDLSPEGLFISSDRPEPLGTLLEVEWEARGSGRTLRALGRVAWIRPEPHEGKPSGMGVEFVKTGPDGRRAISSIPPPGPEAAAIDGTEGGNGAGTVEPSGDDDGASGSSAAGSNGSSSVDAGGGLAERRARLAALRDRVSRARRPGHEAVQDGGNGASATVTAESVDAVDPAQEPSPASSNSPDAREAADEGEDEWESAPTTMMTAAAHMGAALAQTADEPAPSAPATSAEATYTDEVTTTDTDAVAAVGDAVTATDVHASASEAPVESEETRESSQDTRDTQDSQDAQAAHEAVYELDEEDDEVAGEAAAEAAESVADDEVSEGANDAAESAGTRAADDAAPTSVDEAQEAPDEQREREVAAAPTRPDSARPFLLKGDVPKAQFRWKPVMVGATYVVVLGLIVWAIWIRLPWEFLAWLEGPARPPVEQAAPTPAPAPAATPAEPAAAAAPAAPAQATAAAAAAPQEYSLRVTSVPPRAQVTIGNVTILTPGDLSLGLLETPVTLTITYGGYETEQLVIGREGFARVDGLMKRTLSIELLPKGAARAPSEESAAAPVAAPAPTAAPTPAPTPTQAPTPTTAPAPKAARPAKAKPAPAAALAPAPAPEEPKESPLQTAQACLMKGDNACVIQALEGKARTPRELELLVETYRATGNPAKQWDTMRRYVERFPDEKKAAKYRETLGE